MIIGVIYSILHFFVALLAIYFSFKRNNGFDLSSMIAAIFFPWIYVIYVFAVQKDTI